jgi:hypothetical protein
MNAETLGTVHTFSENLFALSISDTEIGGWRNTSSRQPEFVIWRPDEPGRVIALSNYRSNKVAFVSEDMIAIESGYSPMPLVRTDGTLKENRSRLAPMNSSVESLLLWKDIDSLSQDQEFGLPRSLTLTKLGNMFSESISMT